MADTKPDFKSMPNEVIERFLLHLGISSIEKLCQTDMDFLDLIPIRYRFP